MEKKGLKMNKTTLSNLIKEYKGDDLASYVCELIEQDEVLRIKAVDLQKQLTEENNRHKKELKTIDDKWAELEKECPHHETTFYPDASGNNDSETLCDICGKTL